jgi:hypothetical protein
MSTTVRYQIRYSHTSQVESFASLNEALDALETVIPDAYTESYDDGHHDMVLAYVDEAAHEADLDGSRAAAKIVAVEVAS